MKELGYLADAVRDYDGRDVELLAKAYRAFASTDGSADDILTLCASVEPVEAEAASWLLKAYADDGGRLTTVQSRRLIAILDRFSRWQAQLHVCQSVRALSIEPADAGVLVAWLKPLLTSKRPFLRAWSLDALSAVAQLYASHQQAFSDALLAASADEAASVRARARKLATSNRSGSGG